MIKLFIGLFLSLPLFSSAHQKSVFVCKSPGLALEITVIYQSKAMIGKLTTFNEKPMDMKCEGKTYGFMCKKDDYIAKAMKGGNGRMMVHLELEGDFGPFDSGYLYTFSCR